MKWDSKKSFYVLLTILGLATLYVVWGYLGLLFLALVLVIVFEPVYLWILNGVRRPGWAALLATLMILLVVIVPLSILVVLALGQARVFLEQVLVQVMLWQSGHNELVALLNTYFPGSQGELVKLVQSQQSQLANMLQSIIQTLGQVVTKGLVPAVTNGLKFVLDLMVFILLLTYLFPVKKQLVAKIRLLSPLNKQLHDRFVRRFEVVTRTTFKGTLFVGLAQGMLGAIMLGILGIPAAALWGFMMGLAALVPFGAGLVWWPIGIVLLLTGQWIIGLIWIAWGLLVISSVDNVIRSKVLGGGESAMPELVTFIAVLGGIRVFGFMGVMIGPLIAALFLTALEFYLEDRRGSEGSQKLPGVTE
jgi:predicted PurR-regulated permease PerM